MNFSDALTAIRNGGKAARAGWNGIGMWVALRHPEPASHITNPYLYIHTVTGDEVPWVTSQTDILAEDWNVIP